MESAALWTRRARRYSAMLWAGEKAWLLVDNLQIYALLWATSQPWPWPPIWLKWTRWTVAANGDFLSLSERGAAMGATRAPFPVWGEMDGYARRVTDSITVDEFSDILSINLQYHSPPEVRKWFPYLAILVSGIAPNAMEVTDTQEYPMMIAPD